MRHQPCVVGIDVGTTSARAVVYTATGRALAEGRATYPVMRPQFGFCEQQAEWWWRALCQAVRQAVTDPGVELARIQAIAITHQRNTFVPVDSSIRPLRPAILWSDLRPQVQIDRVVDRVGARAVYKRTGFPPCPITLYKTMWLADEQPEIFEATHLFLLVPDYLIYRLSGEIVTASGTASQTGCLDVSMPTRWATDVLEKCGVPENKWVPDIRPNPTVVGYVSKRAAEDTGLPLRLPIVLAAGDQNVGTIGAGIVEEGIVGINGGTSCTLETLTYDLALDPGMNYFVEVSPLQAYLPETVVMSGGGALMDWYCDAILGERERDDGTWDRIYQEIASAPVGNDGLMLIPYLGGAMGPYWDTQARGVLAGLTLSHTRGHLARALVEGLAFESRRQLALLEEGVGHGLDEVRMYGGSARSEVWNAIFADVLGVPVVTTETVETTALGAAICAATGCGLYPDLKTAVKAMVHPLQRYVPDDTNTHVYRRLYESVYVNLYDRVHDLVSQLG